MHTHVTCHMCLCYINVWYLFNSQWSVGLQLPCNKYRHNYHLIIHRSIGRFICRYVSQLRPIEAIKLARWKPYNQREFLTLQWNSEKHIEGQARLSNARGNSRKFPALPIHSPNKKDKNKMKNPIAARSQLDNRYLQRISISRCNNVLRLCETGREAREKSIPNPIPAGEGFPACSDGQSRSAQSRTNRDPVLPRCFVRISSKQEVIWSRALAHALRSKRQSAQRSRTPSKSRDT